MVDNFNSESVIDAHLHLCDIPQVEKEIEFFFSKYDKIRQYSICTSSHSLQDWKINCHIINKIRQKYDNDKIKICHSFGVHPQNPDKNILYDLETLLKYDKTSENMTIKYDKLNDKYDKNMTKYDIFNNKYDKNAENMTSKYDTSEIKYDNAIENMTKYDKVFAIGECGFDLFTDEYKSSFVEQKEIWNAQLELAIKYDKPIIVHCRKGMCHIFESIEKLKKIISVIFHSFPGSVTEANSLRKKGVNAFFSFGKPILNGNKNAMDCVKNLPLEWLLLETDSPYQTLKGEVFTPPTDILKVYEQVFNLRKENSEIIASKIYENFDKSIITNKTFQIL
jgi:TatD DNase family protein